MKKYIILLLLVLIAFPLNVKAEEKEINLHLFYSITCPHCEAEIKWLEDEYLPKKGNVKLYKYEVTENFGNMQRLKKARNLFDDKSSGVPFLVIGNQRIVGYDEKTTADNIKTIINYYEKNNYRDLVGELFDIVPVDENIKIEDINILEEGYKIPILGTINPKTVSLGLAALLIGAVDGFNPCAMWILLFLISMLFGMKNRKRAWIFGITFLVSSALVYLMFMLSWLSFAGIINKVAYIKIAIGVFAVIFGEINIMNYFKSRKKEAGCEVVDDKKRKNIMTKIKNVLSEKSFLVSIIGIIILAASVNVIELMCSLGLPVLFTQLLSMNDLSSLQYGTYIFIYILFFMIDDFIIFFIAMKTMKLKGVSNKYSKYSHLIGGIIMLIIGFLMIFKPEWLMFNF